jgi:hypothetical protein
MVDVVLGEIDLPDDGAYWQDTVRRHILCARGSLQRHPWASRVLESRV